MEEDALFFHAPASFVQPVSLSMSPLFIQEVFDKQIALVFFICFVYTPQGEQVTANHLFRWDDPEREKDSPRTERVIHVHAGAKRPQRQKGRRRRILTSMI